jgi:hypothetical protein
MKKIKMDNLELILENTRLYVIKKRLIQIAPSKWIVESYKEDICKDITLSCEACNFYKEEKCTYQEWFPGLKKGRKW